MWPSANSAGITAPRLESPTRGDIGISRALCRPPRRAAFCGLLSSHGCEGVKKSLAAGSCGSAACSPESSRKLLILREGSETFWSLLDRTHGPAGTCGKPLAFRQAAEPKEFNLEPEVRKD